MGDVVEAIIRLTSSPAAVGEVVNIGNDEEITIKSLAELVKKRTQSTSPIQFVSYSEAYAPGFEDMQRRVPCVDKLKSLTGFRPSTRLGVIVTEVIEYFRKERGVAAQTSLQFSAA